MFFDEPETQAGCGMIAPAETNTRCEMCRYLGSVVDAVVISIVVRDVGDGTWILGQSLTACRDREGRLKILENHRSTSAAST